MLVLVLLTLIASPRPGVATPLKIAQATTQEFADTTSAGYVANYSSVAASVDDVKGFWTVPTVQPSTGQTAVLESIGIGAGDTIIQLGTSQVSHNGAVVYEAWYWVSPESGGTPTTITQLNGKVQPGKVIGAEIKRGTGNTWTLGMIAGSVSGFPDSFSTQVTHASGQASASWIVQPIQPGPPLANFASAAFFWTNATINGVESRLDQLQNVRLNLYDPSSQCALANTGAIDPTNGDNFIVSFIQSTGACSTQSTSSNPGIGLLAIVIGLATVAGVVVLVVVVVFLSLRRKSVSTQPIAWQNSAQPPPPVAARFCSNCRNPIQQGARFCDRCGAHVQ